VDFAGAVGYARRLLVGESGIPLVSRLIGKSTRDALIPVPRAGFSAQVPASRR